MSLRDDGGTRGGVPRRGHVSGMVAEADRARGHGHSTVKRLQGPEGQRRWCRIGQLPEQI